MAEVYQTPEADLNSQEPQGDYGGIRRGAYFLWSFALTAFYYIGIFAVAAADMAVIVVPLAVAVLIGSMYLLVQRFKNQGASPWWAAGVFVPLLNLYVTVRALAYPEGYADHRTLDGAGKTIVGLFLGVALLGIAAAIMLPMMVS